jgi:hypothetical protein
MNRKGGEMMRLSLTVSVTAAALGLALAAGSAPAADAGGAFAFKDNPGKWLDILQGGRIVGRYMYAYDKSSSKQLNLTNKPFLHIFDAEGKEPITNGPNPDYPEGKAIGYPHHRGIFIGWSKVGFEGKSYNRWSMGGGEQVQQKFLDEKAGPDSAAFTSLVFWTDPDGKPILEEERKTTFLARPAPVMALVDFESRLKAPRGDVMLDGDPEHAGVHYRPHNDIKASETVYVFPREGANAHKDTDYPWVGETYSLNGKKYSVVEMNHPENPKDTRYSAYRDYGRFGAFFKKEIKSGQTLTVRYRFLITAGEMPATDAIQKCWDEFAGVKTPTPTPKTTVMPAERKSAEPKEPAAGGKAPAKAPPAKAPQAKARADR